MGIACIIENDPVFLKDIQVALTEIDSKLTIHSFRNLEEFHKWFVESIAEKSEPDPSQAQPQTSHEMKDLKLIVGDIHFLGPRYFSLIEKLRKMMARRGIIAREDDLAVILTAFDAPDLNFKQIESRTINNLIFKPFDPPILRQHLQIALAQQKAITEHMVYSQKINATAEMLKEVQLEYFDEVGFVTRSNREISINAVSKYYSETFQTNGRSSVVARCVSCQAHPSIPNEFLTEFRYFGLSNAQIKKIRQSLFAAEVNQQNGPQILKRVFQPVGPKNKHTDPELNFLLFFNPEHEQLLELKEVIEKNLSGLTVTPNLHLAKFMEAMGKGDIIGALGSKPVHAIIVELQYANGDKAGDTWNKLIEQIETHNRELKVDPSICKPRLFLVTGETFKPSQTRHLAEFAYDLLVLPIERPYLIKRLLAVFRELKPKKEQIEIMRVNTTEVISVANPIELTSMSEASLTMKYHRPISFHSYRRFCLPHPEEDRADELLASCYFNEKKDAEYINHFVFFGIPDKYLKHIRKWMLERYIASKGSNN